MINFFHNQKQLNLYMKDINISATKTAPSKLKIVLKNFQVGVIVSLFTQPFEVLRTSSIHYYSKQRTMVNFKQLWFLTNKMYNDQGMRGFFRGSLLAIIKNGVGCTVFFTGLENFSLMLKKYIPQQQNPKTIPQYLLFSFTGFANAAFSKIFTTLTVAPIIFLKTRYEVIGSQNKSIAEEVKSVYKQSGIRSFYRGTLPTLMRDVPWSGIQYSVYSNLLRYQSYWNSQVFRQFYILSIGSFSSVFAVIITFPFDNLRVRMQIDKQKKGLILRIKDIIKHEGISGLYKGILPRLIKKGVSGGLLWFVYENMWKGEKRIKML